MVPLKNATGPDSLTCGTEQVVLKDDLSPTFTDQAPTGARIYFVAGDHFEIMDRDGTDADGAKIMVPFRTLGQRPRPSSTTCSSACSESR